MHDDVHIFDNIAYCFVVAVQTACAAIGSDTHNAILFLKSIFPVEKFDGRLPAVIFVHQIYSVIHNRTLVDKQLVLQHVTCQPLGSTEFGLKMMLSDDLHYYTCMFERSIVNADLRSCCRESFGKLTKSVCLSYRPIRMNFV